MGSAISLHGKPLVWFSSLVIDMQRSYKYSYGFSTVFLSSNSCRMGIDRNADLAGS